MIYNAATAGSEILNVVKFDAASSSVVENAVASTLTTAAIAANVATIFELSDACTAVRINSNIYHFDNAATPSKYPTDIFPSPAWTNIATSEDFNIIVGDAAIYKYTAGTKTYASALAHTFLTHKKVWTSGTKVLVASWVDSGTTNIKNYSIKAFVANAATYDVVGSIEGQYYETGVNLPPTISVSTTLNTVFVYGSANATGLFAKMKTFDYTAKTQTEITPIPAWITATATAVTVSDAYLYARNTADKVGAAAGTK